MDAQKGLAVVEALAEGHKQAMIGVYKAAAGLVDGAVVQQAAEGTVASGQPTVDVKLNDGTTVSVPEVLSEGQAVAGSKEKRIRHFIRGVKGKKILVVQTKEGWTQRKPPKLDPSKIEYGAPHAAFLYQLNADCATPTKMQAIGAGLGEERWTKFLSMQRRVAAAGYCKSVPGGLVLTKKGAEFRSGFPDPSVPSKGKVSKVSKVADINSKGAAKGKAGKVLPPGEQALANEGHEAALI